VINCAVGWFAWASTLPPSSVTVAPPHAGIMRLEFLDNPNPCYRPCGSDLLNVRPPSGTGKIPRRGVDGIGILRIGDHVHVYRPLIQNYDFRDQVPGVAAISGGTPAFLCFDQSRTRDPNSPPPPNRCGRMVLWADMFFQLFQLVPPSVERYKPLPVSPLESSREAPGLPQRRKQNVGIRGSNAMSIAPVFSSL